MTTFLIQANLKIKTSTYNSIYGPMIKHSDMAHIEIIQAAGLKAMRAKAKQLKRRAYK